MASREHILKELGQRSSDIRSLARDRTMEERVEHLESLYVGLVELLADAHLDGANEASDATGTRSRGLEGEELVNGVSLERINEFVEGLLATSTTNFGWIPDVIERKIDRRILQLVMGLLAKTLSTAAVTVGDHHHLTFSLHPAPRPSEQDGEGDDTLNVPPPTEASKVPEGNMDRVVFTALKSILGSVEVRFFNHDLKLHME